MNPPDRREEIQALSPRAARLIDATEIVKVGRLMKKLPRGAGFGPQKNSRNNKYQKRPRCEVFPTYTSRGSHEKNWLIS